MPRGAVGLHLGLGEAHLALLGQYLDLGHPELGDRGLDAGRRGLGGGPRVLVVGGRDEAALEEGLHALGLPRVVVRDGAGLGQVRLLVLQVRALPLEGGARHLETGFAGEERGAGLLERGLQLEIVHLDQELPRVDEVAAVGVDAADIARDLREDGRLLGGHDVGGEGELDVEVPAGRAQYSYQDVRAGAGHRAGLLILEAIDHEGADQDHQAEEDEPDAVSFQKAHGPGVIHPEYGPKEAPGEVNSPNCKDLWTVVKFVR